MTQLLGNYDLQISIAGQRVYFDPSWITELTITQGIDMTLPSLRFAMLDKSNTITHLLPADSLGEQIDITLYNVNYNFGADSAGIPTENSFNFRVVRRFPTGNDDQTTIYDVSAILDVDGMFAPKHKRNSYEMTISDWLKSIASEMGLVANVSSSLNVDRVLLQPFWSNAQLFRDLRGRLYSELYSDYRIFVSNGYDFRGANTSSSFTGRTVLNVLSVEEMCRATVAEKFSVVSANGDQVNGFKPVSKFEILDSSPLLKKFGGKNQSYGYYDYDTSQYVEAVVDYSQYYSLAIYHLLSKGDTEDSVSLFYGRNTETDPTYEERALTNLYSRMTSYSKMWIDTWGISNMQPGAVVQVVFPQAYLAQNPLGYQYAGLWLVEKVILRLDGTFFTRLLLTRSGVDTDARTTLIPAVIRKQDIPGKLSPVT